MTQSTDLQAVLGLLPEPDLTLLDVGSGRGQLAHALATQGVVVTGVEPDPQQAAYAAQLPPVEGLTLLEGRAEALPFDDDTFDVVLFNRSLHHVPVDLMGAALAQAARVVRPGGSVFVLEPDAAGAHSKLMEPFHDERQVRALAQQALDRVGPPLREAAARSYFRAYDYPDLAAFRARFANTSFIEIDAIGLRAPEVAERFEAGRLPSGGYRFLNPIHVRCFRATSSGRGSA